MTFHFHSQMTAALRFDNAAAATQRTALIDAAAHSRRSAAVPGEILIAGADHARAAEILAARGFEPIGAAGSVTLFRNAAADVETTCAELRDLGLTAGPNHVIVAASDAVGKGRGKAAPRPTALSAADAAGRTDGAGVRVAILDSDAGQARSGVRPGAAGHGTFVAGIVRQLAPAGAITLHRVLGDDGSGTEFAAVEALVALAAEAEAPHLVNLSFVVLGADPVGIQAALRELASRHPDTIVVAAAGNAASSTPVFPAAAKSVLAVGATSAYSNHGYWVDLAVDADGVVSDLPPGVRDTGDALVEQHRAYAAWTGTSFAAPQITGVLATLLGHGLRPAEAIARLSRVTAER